MFLKPQTLLLYLAQPERCVDLSAEKWQKLIWLFREAKLLSSLSAALERANLLTGLPKYAQRHLLSALVYADRQAQQIRYECSELQDIFLKGNIQAYYLKGAAYVLAGTVNSRGRICNDLDVLVKKEHLAAAETLLQQHLWKTDKLTSYDERYYREWSHEIPPMVHILRGTVLDLHHNLYLPISGRSAAMSTFLQLETTTQSGALVLNQEAMVLHSIIHLFMNEETQSAMRDLWDIHLLTAQFSTADFWQNLHSLARATGFELELRYCLTALMYYLDPALDPLTKNQCEQYSVDNWWVRKVLLPALLPDHPMVIGWQQRWAKRFMYLRGHYLKMPLHILLGHLTMKSFFGLRDAIFGKHQFSPKKN